MNYDGQHDWWGHISLYPLGKHSVISIFQPQFALPPKNQNAIPILYQNVLHCISYPYHTHIHYPYYRLYQIFPPYIHVIIHDYPIKRPNFQWIGLVIGTSSPEKPLTFKNGGFPS